MSAPLRVLVDVGVGSAVEDRLRQAGHDVAAVRDQDPRMMDSDILDWAVREQRLVITMDKDFGELVYLSGRTHAGILLLRLQQADGSTKAQIIQSIVSQFSDQLPGHFSVYQDGNLRIR
jgi:predicted nuclease of predicted toxin-antitoxin system